MEKYEIRTNEDGTKFYFLNGLRHREDGPAVEGLNGYEAWWLNGDLHRGDGPAVIWPDEDGTLYKEWWINGKFHREDGPAIEHWDGTKEWYLNGKLHREDGPAIERADGHKEWYKNGKLHREDGPAVIWVDGPKEWWIDGEPIEKNEINYMNITEFRECGYLQEINRMFLHPMGLALEVTINDDGSEYISGVWDYRDDEEGIYYDLKNSSEERREIFRERSEFIEKEWIERTYLRYKKLGFDIEPIPEGGE